MTTPQDDLRALIDAAAGSAPRPQAAQHRAPAAASPSQPQANDAIHALISRAADPALAGPSRRQQALAHPRLLAAALVLALLLAAWAWHALQPALSGPPATLRDLALGVEQYRSQHSGSLPPQLSALPQFPKAAVEWQLLHWKARDAAGRTEIMWAPNGQQHYRIVLRQGQEIWIYQDTDGLSKQTQK